MFAILTYILDMTLQLPQGHVKFELSIPIKILIKFFKYRTYLHVSNTNTKFWGIFVFYMQNDEDFRNNILSNSMSFFFKRAILVWFFTETP
jgi:hypothetical protein